MDATPHLLTDVKFSERRKGYDPEEVDNFLAQVSEKVAQLQEMVREATARADDAERARSLAQAQVDKLEADLARYEGAPPRQVDEQEEAERASKILLMAQKTADATIEDANRSAQAALADARQQAAALLAEAEAEAEKLRVEAKRQIDELVQQRRGQILSEVSELERARDQLAADVEALRNHLEAERANLQRTLDTIKQALDDPAALRVAAPPPMSTVTVPEQPPIEPAPIEQPPIEQAPEPVPVATAPGGEAEAAPDPSGAHGAEPAEMAVATGPALADPAPDVSGGDAPAAEAAVVAPDPAQPVVVDGDERPGDEEVDLTTEKLFDNAEVEEPPLDTGPPTELFTPFAEEGEREDPLGVPDAEADAAMRAFFEADFEAEPEQKRSRWRR